MIRLNKETRRKNAEYDKSIVDNSTIKIIILSSLIVVISVLLMGGASYYITKGEVVKKLKSQDLRYIAKSISAQIDGRIDRAKETSLLLSRDPMIIDWVQESEKDEILGKYAEKEITDVAKGYDYSNSFIVSAITNHYWAEGGQIIDTVSKDDPDDQWFFNTITSKKAVDVVIDYNKERKNTFVFVNALMGDINKPIAVTGVGLDLKEISQEFKSYKFGKNSNLWLIDGKGEIYLSDNEEHDGKNISDFTTEAFRKKIAAGQSSENNKQNVFEYKNNKGEIYDVICEPVKSTEWMLVFQVPRSESLSFINIIKVNTVATGVVTTILIIIIFYLISTKIADPYKRAIVLTERLENKVKLRTQELNERNAKIMDSIEYAKVIQESILPPEKIFSSVFKEHFIIWKPKDIVGGDFYYTKRVKDGYIAAVGDCTGHGVPGALMTMAANSILNDIVKGICSSNPAVILKEMNYRLKQDLQRTSNENAIDDGLDLGVAYISNEGKMLYAGAKISIYRKDINGVQCYKGDKKGIGYKNTNDSYEFNNYEFDLKDDDIFYITTDGFTDQNGGEKDLPFGRKKFEELINKYSDKPLNLQMNLFEEELSKYMKNESQRDDITLLAFKVKL